MFFFSLDIPYGEGEWVDFQTSSRYKYGLKLQFSLKQQSSRILERHKLPVYDVPKFWMTVVSESLYPASLTDDNLRFHKWVDSTIVLKGASRCEGETKGAARGNESTIKHSRITGDCMGYCSVVRPLHGRAMYNF